MELTLYADKQLEIKSDSPTGLMLSGELDAWNVEPAASVLAQHLPDGDIYLDLSRLSFCDVNGIRALIALAEKTNPNQRFVVRGLAPQLRQVLQIVGWARVPQLRFDESGGES